MCDWLELETWLPFMCYKMIKNNTDFLILTLCMKHTEHLYTVLQKSDSQTTQVAKFQANLKHSPQSVKGLSCSTYLVEGYVPVYFKTLTKLH